jgi:hypothetical protein
MTEDNIIKKQGRPLTWFHYIMGAASFIPLLGVLVGILSILWGFQNRRVGGLRILSLGIAGICSTILLYGGIAYHSKNMRESGQLDKWYTEIALKNLNTTTQLIEQYKLQHGHYPSSLLDLEKENIDSHVIMDIFVTLRHEKSLEPFYYSIENNGNNYYLLSVGTDLIPFTKDDIVPTEPHQTNARWGLLIKKNI